MPIAPVNSLGETLARHARFETAEEAIPPLPVVAVAGNFQAEKVERVQPRLSIHTSAQ